MKKEKPFKITQEEVLEAYKKVKANKGAPGIDEVSLQEYENNLKNNLYKLWNRMASGTYFPQAVRSVEIPKKNGKGVRLLGVPTINDRIAQTVIVGRLEPHLEPLFYPDSYGYRPGKKATDAIGVTRERCWRYEWVIEFDVKGLFDNINHELLMKAVQKHIDTKWVLLYIQRSLKAPMKMPDGTEKERSFGTPQGGVISAILSNLFMHYAFDHWITRTWPENPWARYADDGLIHCHTQREAELILEQLKQRMSQCQLEIHPEKTKIVYCKDENRPGDHEHTSFDFLGYTFRARTVKTRKGKYFTGFTPAVSKDAIKSLRVKVRRLRKLAFLSMTELAQLLNPIIRGWANYFKHYTPSAVHSELSQVNLHLARWVMRKYKRFKNKMMAALGWLGTIAKSDPALFVHWKMGICPKGD
ncbi:group II intron reverse transcriptase/maturase [Anoxynatronum sibiricum]|uniref:Group II intron reverse transcriptase/maturase n=1 Tax=Anoxynatronum sibiricum TaxID=210623 RepID=A0ABU9VSW2_9CLOT